MLAQSTSSISAHAKRFKVFWSAGVMLSAATLAGCSPNIAGNSAHIYPGLFGQNVVGNEVYVTVSNVYNEMDALPLADQHCKKYGKAARFNRMEQIRATFDCVRPS